MIIGIDASRAFGADRTGTENYSYHLINHMLRLPASRAHTFVLFVRPNAVIPDWARVSHAEVVTVRLKYLWTQLGLAWATWTQAIDVLWVPAHTLPVLRKPGIRTVVTIHGLEYQWLPEYRNLLQRWYLPLSTFYAAKNADRLIAVSDFTKRQLVTIGTSPDKIDVIYEGVEFTDKSTSTDQSDFQRICAQYQIGGSPYILFVGTVQPRKNISSLIDAFSRVLSQLPGIKLVIAGGKGWMTDDIYQAPQKYGVQESVIFTGRVDDATLSTLYSHATLYVQPSLQEGFGLPVLEAMQRKVPVLTSDGGALPEVVGTAGVIVPLGNQFAHNMAQQIVRILTDTSFRHTLIGKGQKRIFEFSWSRAATETLSILTNIKLYKT